MSSKKSITGFVLTNYVSIIPKAISCSWTTVKISIFQFQLINTQYQSSLKYFGVILDDKLNWKPQIEKLVTQLSKSCGMLFKSKHYTSISVLKSVYFSLFHSYLTYSILNWERANKMTFLPPIRLQNKAVRTLEYNKTKTPVLYSQTSNSRIAWNKLIPKKESCKIGIWHRGQWQRTRKMRFLISKHFFFKFHILLQLNFLSLLHHFTRKF